MWTEFDGNYVEWNIKGHYETSLNQKTNEGCCRGYRLGLLSKMLFYKC